MSLLCQRCGPGRLFDDTTVLCDVHLGPLETYDAADWPDSDAAAEPVFTDAPPSSPTACWNCKAEPHPGNTECVECNRSLTPPAMVIRFPHGLVEIERGSQAELGRHGRYKRLFRAFRNVSRRHAVVGVDADGRAWIEPNPTPNGTFVDRREIQPAVRLPLKSHQVIRFALNAEGTVTVYTGVTT
jgi:hypothetical protein